MRSLHSVIFFSNHFRSRNNRIRSDIKEIKRRAVDTYQVETLAAHKKKQKSGLAYVWRLHKEVKPAQILSLRVIEGYLSPEEPKFGSRLMVHALVKFDTEQVYHHSSLDIHHLSYILPLEPRNL